jgi:hypothetical protein
LTKEAERQKSRNERQGKYRVPLTPLGI